jgi:hypothetical protein
MIPALIAAATLAAPTFGAQSTAYCLRGRMSDGTYTRYGSAASNRHPLGTRIRLRRRGPGGVRTWVIRDHIGWGSELDFWQPSCSAARAWGRRFVTYRVVRRRS